MSARGATAIGAIAALTGMVLAAAVLQARETGAPLPEPADRFLYLQSGKAANRLFLTFDALAADLYWIRTIQHYGRDRKSSRVQGRFEQLEPLLDITTSLDPRFNIAYRFGAIFLSLDPPNGPGKVDAAIRLLEKGLAQNARWQYAHDLGFIHYWYTGDYKQAAGWFEKAAAMPNAPEWIAPLAALTLAQGGDRTGARRLLADLLTADEPYIRTAANRSMAQLEAMDRIDNVRDAVEKYQQATRRYPANWNELIEARAIPGLPLDPTGLPLVYDPATHAVNLSSGSSLNPLPRGLLRPAGGAAAGSQ